MLLVTKAGVMTASAIKQIVDMVKAKQATMSKPFRTGAVAEVH